MYNNPRDGVSTVLVVDDQPVNIKAVYQTLSPFYKVLMATSGHDCLAVCEQHRPDLVLLDLVMPGINGLDVAARLKADPSLKDIPIIFITGSSGSEDEDACWEAGAVDFICKPFNPMTLMRRVNVHLTLQRQAEMLRQMAYIDGLTQLPNRRYFNDRLDAEFARVRRESSSLAVMLADVDFFKRYNDCYGHQAGDLCLQKVAQAFKRALLRPADFSARYGGEEFALLVPGADADTAMHIAQRVRNEVHALALPHSRSDVAAIVTVSIGIACFDASNAIDIDAMLRAADVQLYRAKEAGRDQACIALPASVFP